MNGHAGEDGSPALNTELKNIILSGQRYVWLGTEYGCRRLPLAADDIARRFFIATPSTPRLVV